MEQAKVSTLEDIVTPTIQNEIQKGKRGGKESVLVTVEQHQVCNVKTE